MNIIWRVIPDFPDYEIANTGQVRRIDTGKLLKATATPGWVGLRRDKKTYSFNAFVLRDELFTQSEQRPH